MKSFEEKMRDFLVSEGSVNPRDIKVEPHGSDWAGGTESGFYSVFTVAIRWRDDSSEFRFADYEGEDMERLWKAVVIDA